MWWHLTTFTGISGCPVKYLFLLLALYIDVDRNHTGTAKNSDIREAQILDIPHSLVRDSLFRSHSFSHPQGVSFPLLCLHITCFLIYTQSPVSVCVHCFFVFCFVLTSGLRSNLWIFGCICLCECTCFCYFKQEGEHECVPLWCSSTTSVLLPEICLNGTGGRGGQAWVASPLMFCSARERQDAAIPS